MGADYFALSWLEISNFVGLDIEARTYPKGAYTLCNLPPTKRRNPPAKKQIERHDYRASAATTIEPANHSTGTTTEPVKPLLSTFTGTTTGHNVVIPLPLLNSANRMKLVRGVNSAKKYERKDQNDHDQDSRYCL